MIINKTIWHHPFGKFSTWCWTSLLVRRSVPPTSELAWTGYVPFWVWIDLGSSRQCSSVSETVYLTTTHDMQIWLAILYWTLAEQDEQVPAILQTSLAGHRLWTPQTKWGNDSTEFNNQLTQTQTCFNTQRNLPIPTKMKPVYEILCRFSFPEATSDKSVHLDFTTSK